MLSDVIQYTKVEGGELLDWPYPASVKPSNPFLLTVKLGNPSVYWVSFPYVIEFHSLIFSDGSRWDSINGFNDEKGPR